MSSAPPPLLRYPSLEALPGLVHGLSTRRGGVSPAPYHSLNLGLHVGDQPERVIENRRRVTQGLGFGLDDLVLAAQVHGAAVARVGLADRGRGARDLASALPAADALITDRAGLLLGLLVADCLPLFLAEVGGGALGLAHAGWRGTAADIAGRTVQAMSQAYGTRPDRLVAVIGPGIGPDCFVVGPEVLAAFHRAFGDGMGWLITVQEDGRGRVDLAEANRLQFLRAGLRPDRIHRDPACTASDRGRFFSHRAEGGRTGRFGAFLGRRVQAALSDA